MSEKTSYDHGQFCWVDLVAHDRAAAQAFYEGLFGWKGKQLDTQGGPPYFQFELNGKGVGGMGEMSAEMKGQGIPSMWNNYINVDDVNVIAKKAEELGGKVTMPVMKVVDAGWMAYIQDPTGGNVGFWQKNQHFGAELVNDVGSFCWNELATRDIEKAREFFGKLLGWEYEDNPAPSKYYIIKNKGNMNGGLMQMNEQWGDMPPCWSVYFSVENTDQAVEKVSHLGGKTMVPPFDIPVGRMAVVADVQGAVFSVIALTKPPD